MKSNGQRQLPSGKSMDEALNKKKLKSKPSLAQKDKLIEKRKEKPEEMKQGAAIVQADGKSYEKRANVLIRKGAPPMDKGSKRNEGKRVPISNSNTPKNSKTTPKIKENGNMAKIAKAKTGEKVLTKSSHVVIAKSIVSPQNVMNQVHNVTVSSPPQMRRGSHQNNDKSKSQNYENIVSRNRMRTRTLEKSEVILLKPKSESTPSLETSVSTLITDLQAKNAEIRQPITFEVHFNKHLPQTDTKPDTEDEEESYADDFESYESDFEDDLSSSGSLQSIKSDQTSTSINDSMFSRGEVYHDKLTMSNDTNAGSESRSYEMKPMSLVIMPQNAQFQVQQRTVDVQHDSGIETSIGTTKQLAHSSCGGILSSLEVYNSKTYDNISDIEIETNANILDSPRTSENPTGKFKRSEFVARLNRRGAEILKKITLDIMNYVVYDRPPIPYDLFMQIYGKKNTAQVPTQTHNTRTDQDTQSEPIDLADIWVQHPPTFYSCHMAVSNFDEYKNGCSAREVYPLQAHEKTLTDCVKRLQRLANSTGRKVVQTQISEISYDRLNRFLLAIEITISKLLKCTNRIDQTHVHDSFLDSFGYFSIELEMKEFQVLRILAPPTLPGFLVSLHHEIDGHLHLIVVWNLAFAKNPVCILSSWTPVLCIDVHASARSYVLAGLDDGLVFFSLIQKRMCQYHVKNSCF